MTTNGEEFDKALDAAPTPPAQEDEPVGSITRVELFGVHVSAYLNSKGEALPDDTPLYTRPQSDKLREAAAEIIRDFHGPVVDKLRKALEDNDPRPK